MDDVTFLGQQFGAILAGDSGYGGFGCPTDITPEQRALERAFFTPIMILTQLRDQPVIEALLSNERVVRRVVQMSHVGQLDIYGDMFRECNPSDVLALKHNELGNAFLFFSGLAAHFFLPSNEVIRADENFTRMVAHGFEFRPDTYLGLRYRFNYSFLTNDSASLMPQPCYAADGVVLELPTSEQFYASDLREALQPLITDICEGSEVS